MKFNMTSIKKNAKENSTGNLDLIRDFGHPHYAVFDSQISECGKYEIFVDIAPGRLNLTTGKSGYALEVEINSITPGADLESDGYHGEQVASLERTLVQTRADLWALVSRTISHAQKKAKE